jgi:hypothetical protein
LAYWEAAADGPEDETAAAIEASAPTAKALSATTAVGRRQFDFEDRVMTLASPVASNSNDGLVRQAADCYSESAGGGKDSVKAQKSEALPEIARPSVWLAKDPANVIH